MTKAELQNLVIDYADAYSIDRAIALAQAQKESGFRQDVIYGPTVSSTGARGLMQFMPGTWLDYGQGSFDNAFDPELNLWAWGTYMQRLLNRYNWDYRKALMGYYGGPGRVDKGTTNADIQNYADSILRNAGSFSSQSGQSSDISPLADSAPSNDSTIFGLPIVLALAIGGFGLYLALKD